MSLKDRFPPIASSSFEIDLIEQGKDKDGRVTQFEDIKFDAEIFEETDDHRTWVDAHIGDATCYMVKLDNDGEEIMRMFLTGKLIDKYAPLEDMQTYAERNY